MTQYRTLKEIIADLSKPLPPEFLATKQVQGNTLTFIPWHKAVLLLDMYAPDWSYDVETQGTFGTVNEKKGTSNGMLIVKATITIPHLSVGGTNFMTTSRSALGNELDSCSSYGDPSSNAESMALRRALSKFGGALYLYDKEKREAAAAASVEAPEYKDDKPAYAPKSYKSRKTY